MNSQIILGKGLSLDGLPFNPEHRKKSNKDMVGSDYKDMVFTFDGEKMSVRDMETCSGVDFNDILNKCIDDRSAYEYQVSR